MTEYSDKEILRTFNTNPSKGFDLLVKNYQERLYWHIRKILIDHDDTNDVLQNVFIKVWKIAILVDFGRFSLFWSILVDFLQFSAFLV